MAGFWEHYAQANDDIRTKLIDQGWFDQRVGSNAMERDVHSMSEQNSAKETTNFYGDVQQDQNVTQNFYGEPAEAEQQSEYEVSDDIKAVYGEDAQQADGQDFYGTAEETEQVQANDLYGYDALDEEPEQVQTQRL